MNKLSTKLTALLCLALFSAAIMAGCPGKAKKPEPPDRPRAEADRFKGKEPIITLYINETGQRKKIKLEEYLKGVVAAEMDPTWPVNALAAQAILARTFTLKQILTKGGVPQHKADASTNVAEFQAYDPTRINANVIKAVNMTRGEVIKYRGQYVNAWFSACDGGETASAREGLAYNKEATPYLKAGVKDGCLTITVPENKSWTQSFPIDTVRSAVINTTGQDPGEINSSNVKIAQKGPSGRAEALQIGRVTVGGPALRLALGNDRMRSIYIDSISVQGATLVMHGKGYGHGVGMCQWGARKMAGAGKSPEDIVKFYFRGITIDNTWK